MKVIDILKAIFTDYFYSGQKKFSRKLDTGIIIGGAAILSIKNKPLIWLSAFALIIAYFLMNSFRHKSAYN